MIKGTKSVDVSVLERYCCKVDDLCFTFIKWTGHHEKKETVLDCYVPGARGETLMNLVNSSMLRASILSMSVLRVRRRR